MEQQQMPAQANNYSGNNIFTKAAITACLVLVLMLPMLMISNLVKERKERNETVVKEVSKSWAGSQTLAGPFIYVPYQSDITGTGGKKKVVEGHLWILPEDLEVQGTLAEMIRQKSIYKIMLYRSEFLFKGKIKIHSPSLSNASIRWQDARICFGISDFRGIEDKIEVNIGEKSYELAPGLPAADLVETGLSAPVNLAGLNPGTLLSFNLSTKLRGSEKLHFIPLSGNSKFYVQSGWHSPSFDGNNIPADRKVSDYGFTATWTFSKANLPFSTAFSNLAIQPQDYAFGVSLMQPTDQYVKTDRCIKYAILFIGLSFALFFIIELMQKKALHPVQYTLIGLALIIFYTLLLSASELIEFDYAYLLAASATVGLITWYSAIHFRKAGLAILLFCSMAALYGFIFVLIRMEDTSLLFGSIGLFLVLAMAMYFSRKINWYGNKSIPVPAIEPEPGLASYE